MNWVMLKHDIGTKLQLTKPNVKLKTTKLKPKPKFWPQMLRLREAKAEAKAASCPCCTPYFALGIHSVLICTPSAWFSQGRPILRHTTHCCEAECIAGNHLACHYTWQLWFWQHQSIQSVPLLQIKHHWISQGRPILRHTTRCCEAECIIAGNHVACHYTWQIWFWQHQSIQSVPLLQIKHHWIFSATWACFTNE